MRPPENNSDILIIGGGASGLAAACAALKSGASLRILEARDRVGRKLLATGNGRCNLLNAGQPRYFGDSAFALQVVAQRGYREVRAFFEDLGLVLTREEDGLVYPASKQATSVLDVLRLPLEYSPRCDIRLNARVSAIRTEGGGFRVRCEDGSEYTAKKLIVAAGGPAHPQTSGSDSIFAPLEDLGYRLVPLRPALSALVTDKQAVRGLRGLRLPAIARLCEDEHTFAQSEGEVLFAEDGVSGVCVMQLSRDAGELLARGRKVSLYLDFAPLLGILPRRMRRSTPQPPLTNEQAVLAFLTQRAEHLPPERLLHGALPRLLQQRLQGLSLAQLARSLCAFRLPVRGQRGFEHAQAAAGGIDCADINPLDMQSRLHPGLYLCGEVLNVDGDCGGHNLLFAWASGLAAGEAAAGGAGEQDPEAVLN